MVKIIKLSQIHAAINDTITNALVGTDFSQVTIYSEDEKSAFQSNTDGTVTALLRPSLRITFDSTQAGKFNSQLKERNLTVRIYFFAQDKYKYKKDNLKMQDLIENAFLEDVQVTPSFFMPISNEEGVQSQIIDTVLECSFDLYSLEEIYDDSALEPIEELNFNLNLEEE